MLHLCTHPETTSARRCLRMDLLFYMQKQTLSSGVLSSVFPRHLGQTRRGSNGRTRRGIAPALLFTGQLSTGRSFLAYVPLADPATSLLAVFDCPRTSVRSCPCAFRLAPSGRSVKPIRSELLSSPLQRLYRFCCPFRLWKVSSCAVLRVH